MKISKSPKIETSWDDDFLYEKLTRLLEQIKIVQGGTELAYTLRNHQNIKLYLISKQIEKIKHIEKTYFKDDGSLNQFAIENFHARNRSGVFSTGQRVNNGVN